MAQRSCTVLLSAAPPPRLSPGEVHLWFLLPGSPALADPELLTRYDALMSDEERAQQQRYVFARHRQQALLARALVRATLSRYAPEVHPAGWRFARGAHGRPAVVGPGGAPPLHFNLSHTTGLMVCGVSLEPMLGVDVEHTPRRLDLGVAERCFTADEQREIEAQPLAARKERFFEHWTLKEAYIKARGEGMALSLRLFGFTLEGARITACFAPALGEVGPWRFALLVPSAEHRCALAVRAPGPDRVVLSVGQVVPLSWEAPLACALLATGRHPA